MQKVFVTSNSKQTQKLGEILAKELSGGPASCRRVSASQGGGIICLTGELGSGKTTFTQGLLKGLKIPGHYTSPTFVVMKQYKKHKKPSEIYHIDAYRVMAEDILNLGWEEIIADKNNIIIIEWADRIKKIIPKNALWINFSWMSENERKMSLK